MTRETKHEHSGSDTGQDYLVTMTRLEDQPGYTWLVTSAPSPREAQRAALRANGYHPGCPITVQLLTVALRQHRRAGTLGQVRWQETVEYSPLTADELEMVRDNG